MRSMGVWRSVVLVVATACIGSTAQATETGTNDFRVSFAGGTGDAAVAAQTPAAAYNELDNEYLVVWSSDDSAFGLADGEFEIIGQRVDASSGALVGAPFRISDMGPDGDADFDAIDPRVAFNPSAGIYLVVWSGDDDTGLLVNNEFEIWGQYLDRTGSDAGFANDFRVSDMGPDGNSAFDAVFPDVAYDSAQDQFFVVWAGDDTASGEREVYGQFLAGTDAIELGTNDFQISDVGPAGDPTFNVNQPRVAYNSVNNEFLVVWWGDDDVGGLVDEELEIFGQRIDAATGLEVGNDDFRISDIGGIGAPSFDALDVDIAYNSVNNEYLVVWEADDADSGQADNEFEIYGQRIHGDRTLGDEVGNNDFRISEMGPDGAASYDAIEPQVAHNPAVNEYFVVWRGDHNVAPLVDGEFEVFGQRIHGDRTLGDQTGPNDERLSDMGPDGDVAFGAFAPTVAYNSMNNEFGVFWQGDDDTGGLIDGEFEIFGQRYQNPNAPPVITLPSGDLNYTENDGAVPIDAAATVFDPDSLDFDGGMFTVTVTNNFAAGEDRLSIQNQGNGAGQIGMVNPNVFFGGVIIGTVAPPLPSDSGTFTVTLNAAATQAAAQALARAVTYENLSDNPSLLNRTVSFTLSDGDGATSIPATKLIHITALNDAPTFTSVPVEDALVGSPYTYNVTTDDVDGDIPAITATTLPGWLTLTDNSDGTASLTGTPVINDLGPHAVVLQANDGNGGIAIQSFTVTVFANAITVDSLVDANNGNTMTGDVDLREAVTFLSDGGTITFGVNGTLTLTMGEIVIDKPMTINGAGPANTVIAGAGSRLFNIDAGGSGETVNLSDMTLQNGNAGAEDGGAIWNNESLQLTRVVIQNNTAVNGGGLFNETDGEAFFLDSLVTNNTAVNGGGVANTGNGVIGLSNTTLSRNMASGQGGAIDNAASGIATTANVTAAFNSAATGGGFANAGTFTVQNTIVAGNMATTSPDVSGTFVGNRTNLVSDLTGSTGFVASEDLDALGFANVSSVVDPNLASNGDTTLTHALIPGGPAIDGGTNAFAVDVADNSALANDQRGAGFPRIFGGTVDVGAFEFQCDPMSITEHPQDVVVCEGSDAVFMATAPAALSVQWQVSTNGVTGPFSDLAGQNGNTLTIPNTDVSMNGNAYRAVFMDACSDNVPTAAAVLTVDTPVSVSSNPLDATVCEGNNAIFTIAFDGPASTVIQWQVSTDGVNFAPVAGNATAATDTLVLTAVDPSLDGNLYRAALSTACNAVNSSAALLTVNTIPVVTQHPESQTACPTQSVTFMAAASGQPAPSVQWQVNTGGGFADIPGAMSASLTVSNLTLAEDGNQYRAGFMNPCGSMIDSNAATLTVADEAPIELPAKHRIIFGPELQGTFLHATDGMFVRRVHITWSDIPGADAYQVYRGVKSNLSDATPISGWITEPFFNDYDVNVITINGKACETKVVSELYYYYVVARNICGESNPSGADSGWALTRYNTAFDKALPSQLTADGAQLTPIDSPISVRIKSDVPLLPDSISGIVRADSLLDIAGVTYQPVVANDYRDVWVTYTPAGRWQHGEVIYFTVAARNQNGVLIEPVTIAFQVDSADTGSANELAQPAYSQYDASSLDLSQESADSLSVVPVAQSGLPVLSSGVGAEYELGPMVPFDVPQRVWLPVPAGHDASALSAYFFHHEQGVWVEGDDVDGWIVPGSERALTVDGQPYYGFLIKHGAIVQLGLPGQGQVAEAVLLPRAKFGAGAVGDLAILAVIALVSLAVRTQRRPATK